MFRKCLAILAMLAPVFVLLAIAGCEEKTTTVQQTEQRHESTPQMTSPGEEVIE